MASIHEILRPSVLTKVVSRKVASSSWLLNFMGMQPGGTNEAYFGHGREGLYHVYDNVRKIGTGRAPGSPAGRVARNPVGRVPFVYPRMHEQISLLAEELHNLARIDDLRVRDEAGGDFIRRQTATSAQRAANWRTAMVVGMLRDSLYVHQDGDDWYFSYDSSGALYQINYQMPAGNKSQLDMLGDGDIIDASWATSSTTIPKHIMAINAAFQQLNGGMLTDVICGYTVWNAVINNEDVAGVHGTASPPFQMFERQMGTTPDGRPLNVHVGQLSVLPGVTWWITDEGLELGAPGSEAFVKHVEDDYAIFLNSPQTADLFTLYQGSEPIAEYDGGPESVRVGLSSWSKKSSNPTSTEIFTLDNCLPVNHVPDSVAYAEVIF
jgi:hypothetical protein